MDAIPSSSTNDCFTTTRFVTHSFEAKVEGSVYFITLFFKSIRDQQNFISSGEKVLQSFRKYFSKSEKSCYFYKK